VTRDTPSAPWAAHIVGELDACDRRAAELVRGLTPDQLNWTPGDGRWSIGQCLDHLLVSNDVYLPPIARALDARTPRSPVDVLTPGWGGRWFIRNYIEPSPASGRHRAPGKIAPARQVDASVLDRFVRSNDAARALVRRAAAYDVNRIRFVNPFVPLVRFTVGTGLEIVWRHQRRHLLQAERVRSDAAFPAR
jgi:hypothetical protein